MDITGEDEWSDWEDDDMPARSLLEDKMLPSAKVKGPTVHTCKTQNLCARNTRDCQLWWLCDQNVFLRGLEPLLSRTSSEAVLMLSFLWPDTTAVLSSWSSLKPQ